MMEYKYKQMTVHICSFVCSNDGVQLQADDGPHMLVCLCSNNGVQIQADDNRVLFTSLEGVDARIISYLLHSMNLPH
jgi:hypothetical protein